MTASVSLPAGTAPVTGREAARRPVPPLLAAGGALLAVIVACAAAAPLLVSADPVHQDLLNGLQPPSAHHLLGTDQLGRDVLSRLLFGARTDLFLGIAAVVLPFVIGSVLGALAGYRGGLLDTVVMRAVDIVVAFPFYVLVIAVVFALGPGRTSIIGAVTMVGWASYARIVRGEVLVARRQEYVLAARVGGVPAWRILLRHIGPNVITQAIVFAMTDIVMTILAIVTLGYLGLGVQPPAPEWGQMISDGQQFISTNWWLTTAPGCAVVVTGIALALIGDGLADALRPE